MIPDYNDFCDMHDAEVCRRIERLPKCAKCGEPILSEEAYDIDGLWCEDCFNDWLRDITVTVDELVEDD